MSKNKKENSDQKITIDGTEHNVSDMSPDQINLINHIHDLDRKIGSTTFNLEQLQYGRQAIVNGLSQSLNTQE